MIFLHKSEPKYKLNEEEDNAKQIILTNGKPEIVYSIEGVIYMKLNQYLNPITHRSRVHFEKYQFFPVKALEHTSFQFPTKKD